MALPLLAFGLGAGAGILKNRLVDMPAYKAQSEIEGMKTAYGPLLGTQGNIGPKPSAFKAALDFGLTGASAANAFQKSGGMGGKTKGPSKSIPSIKNVTPPTPKNIPQIAPMSGSLETNYGNPVQTLMNGQAADAAGNTINRTMMPQNPFGFGEADFANSRYSMPQQSAFLRNIQEPVFRSSQGARSMGRF